MGDYIPKKKTTNLKSYEYPLGYICHLKLSKKEKCKEYSIKHNLVKEIS